MPFSIDSVVPWGRSLAEYCAMFALKKADLENTIIGCGDGPASFNFEMYSSGKRVVSVDPIYQFSRQQITKRIKETYPVIMEQMHANKETFTWKHFESPEHLGRIRMAAMEQFLSDFELGREQGRYLSDELPVLPFEDQHFDLALSSHLLFLYSNHLSYDFHLYAIKEMLRVAREVRIFPLLTLDGTPYPQLQSVCDRLEENHHHFKIQTVEYEFQRGGNQLLRIW